MLKMKNKHTNEISYIDEKQFNNKSDWVFKYKIMRGQTEKKSDLIEVKP